MEPFYEAVDVRVQKIHTHYGWWQTDFQAVVQEQGLTQWPGCPSLLPSNNAARAGRRISGSGSSSHSERETGIPSSSAEINRLSAEQRAVLLSARGWWNAAELRPTWVKLVAVNQRSQLLRRLWKERGGTGVKNPQPSCLSVRIRALRPHPPPAVPAGPSVATVGKSRGGRLCNPSRRTLRCASDVILHAKSRKRN